MSTTSHTQTDNDGTGVKWNLLTLDFFWPNLETSHPQRCLRWQLAHLFAVLTRKKLLGYFSPLLTPSSTLPCHQKIHTISLAAKIYDHFVIVRIGHSGLILDVLSSNTSLVQVQGFIVNSSLFSSSSRTTKPLTFFTSLHLWERGFLCIFYQSIVIFKASYYSSHKKGDCRPTLLCKRTTLASLSFFFYKQ